jgi:UPF0755 protein
MGKVIKIGLVLLVLAGAVIGYVAYNTIFKANTNLSEDYELRIKEVISVDSLVQILEIDSVLKNTTGFSAVAERKNVMNVLPGRYIIKPGMSSNAIINMLRAGLQVPVKLTFIAQPNVRKLASIISEQIQPDSADIINYITTDFIRENELTLEILPAYFIPNSYEVYWNTGPESFGKRMLKEYNSFWNADRLAKAESFGLTPVEVSTLASIVEGETNKTREMPRVAGLYLNRLEKGQKLESDPTVRFTIKQKYGQDYKIKRVLYKDLKIDSPYNTYMYTGLPPGPLSIPSIQAIDAVLNAEEHNYIFMCADPSTGYHKFTASYAQHLKNRDAYKRWLQENKIYR